MKITYDHVAQTVYILLRDEPIASTSRVAEGIHVGVDQEGEPVEIIVTAEGIDFTNLSVVQALPSNYHDLLTANPERRKVGHAK